MKHSRLNQLSKDEMVRLALFLDLPEILTFCRLAKKFNRNVCQNKNFWISRLKQDFGFNYLEISPNKSGNPKEYYEFFHKYKTNNKRLWVAAKEGNIDIVKFMINQGADVHAARDWALRLASINGHTEIVKLLIKEGADIHALNDQTLIDASVGGHTEIVKLLIKEGANVHAYNGEALRYASHNGHTEIVKLLIKEGANVHANNNEALKWASANGHTEIVKLLKSYY